MADAQDADYFRQRLDFELSASKDAAAPQIAWLHWDMATRYAVLLVEKLGIEAVPPIKRRLAGRPPRITR